MDKACRKRVRDKQKEWKEEETEWQLYVNRLKKEHVDELREEHRHVREGHVPNALHDGAPHHLDALAADRSKRLVVIEIGAGTAVPSVR